jgi:hypothetical protein
MKFEFLDLNYNPVPEGEEPVRFGFECPKSKAGYMCSGLVIRNNPLGLNPPNQTWEWNGDRVNPTFNPSINCQNCSHGWIREGKWTDA